ncbi:MAG: hypothetical protein PHQ11_04890 [Paludibacter sp.]|nr:hypothetical protein [Paludibacter sp.]
MKQTIIHINDIVTLSGNKYQIINFWYQSGEIADVVLRDLATNKNIRISIENFNKYKKNK